MRSDNAVTSPPLADLRGHPLLVVVLATILFQSFCVSWTFPITELFSDRPLFYTDSPYHWYQMRVAVALAADGRLTGYDPYFAAGHLAGVTFNGSAKVPALLSAVFGGAWADTQIYKLYAFAAAVVAPSLVPIAAYLFRMGRPAIWLAACLGICAWWASSLRWYHTAGMVSFVLASYLALPYTALLIRTACSSAVSTLRIIFLGAIGAGGLFLHPLFPVPVAFAVFCFIAAEWRRLDWTPALARLGTVALLSLLPNLPWIVAMLNADATALGMAPYQKRIDISIVLRELLAIWQDDSKGSKINLGLLAASVFAAIAAPDDRVRRFGRTFVVVWALIVLFASVGAALPGVGNIQPNRLSAAAYAFLVLPAALGCVAVMTMLAHRPTTRRLAFGVASAVFLAIPFGWSATEVAREISYSPIGHYGPVPPEVRGLGAKSNWLVNWLTQNTTTDGRILFETSHARVHDQAHMAGYYAASADREFIGGPYPYMFFAGFWDGFAFGKSLESMTPSEFQKYLHLYNIGWIIAHSKISKIFLATVDGVVPMDDYDNIQTYRVEQPLSFFLQGSGRVTGRHINRIVLADMDGPEVVIKYHHVSGLTVDPPAKVEPYWVTGVPQPFVRLTSVAAPSIELSIR